MKFVQTLEMMVDYRRRCLLWAWRCTIVLTKDIVRTMSLLLDIVHLDCSSYCNSKRVSLSCAHKTLWFGLSTEQDTSILQHTIRSAERIIGLIFSPSRTQTGLRSGKRPLASLWTPHILGTTCWDFYPHAGTTDHCFQKPATTVTVSSSRLSRWWTQWTS